MRPKMSDAERLAKKKARSAFSFSDAAYVHYNPKVEGYGSSEEWMRMAEALLNSAGIAFRPAGPDTQLTRDLRTLNLDELPKSAADLKRAFRNTLFIVHPDHGGTNEATIEAYKAFERLSKQYR